MRIAVIGAGGVGGYFGGRLAQAGEDVVFLARGAHLDAMRRDGLEIRSPRGDARISPVRVSDDPAELGPADVVLVAVKNWDTESAGRAAARLAAPRGEVVSVQNGVEAWDVLAAASGLPVLGGVALITSFIAAPGVIRHDGPNQRLVFGAFDGRRSAAAEGLRDALLRAGLDAEIRDDIRIAIWEKFVFLTAFSAMTALSRGPIGPVRDNPRTRDLLHRAMAEAAAVGRARGVRLGDDLAARMMAWGDRPGDPIRLDPWDG